MHSVCYRYLGALIITAAALSALALPARADAPGRHRSGRRQLGIVDKLYGGARFRRHSDWLGPLHRAGHPQRTAWYARPEAQAQQSGYYVGGSALLLGEPRATSEGVWGWDYVGRHFRRGVNLKWLHGRRPQHGAGAYQTDGPHLIPK